MGERLGAPVPRPRPLAAYLLAFWLLLGSLYGVQRLVVAHVEGAAMPAARAVALGYALGGLFALEAAAALGVAGAFPLRPGGTGRNLALSLGLLSVAIVALAQVEAWLRGALGDVVIPVPARLPVLLPGRVMIFFNVVAVGHALACFRALRERERSAARLEAEIAASQLELMRAKVQPQLLYGMLDSLSELVRADARAADAALTQMSDYLRGTLYREPVGSAPVRTQAGLLRAYLAMLAPARGTRASVEVHASAAEVPVPHLLLEALVDLAAGPRGDGAVLRVRIDGEGGGARIVVAGPAAAEAVEAALAPVRQRLASQYGGAERLQTAPAVGGGVQIAVWLPAAIQPSPAAAPVAAGAAGA